MIDHKLAICRKNLYASSGMKDIFLSKCQKRSEKIRHTFNVKLSIKWIYYPHVLFLSP